MFHQRISTDLAAEIWSTVKRSGCLAEDVKSFVVHDLGRMRDRLQNLQSVFPRQSRHTLAIKANPLVEILRVAVGCGVGLEAASIEEVELAVAAGCPAEQIIFDSPAKTRDEIQHCLKLGVHLNVDNFDELERIGSLYQTVASASTVGLRINPEVGVGTIAITSVGGTGSKFGVSVSKDHDRILDAFVKYDWLVGLHAHVGSQGCALDLLCRSAARLQQLRREIVEHTGRRIPLVNIGGGLPAAYDDAIEPPSPSLYAEQLAIHAPDLMGDEVTLMTEFGRAVQAGCGVAFSRVEYVRRQSQRVVGDLTDSDHSMAVIHLGADMFLRPVYRPDDWKHEYALLDASGLLKTQDSRQTTIAGPLCFAGDILTREALMPEPRVGDWIVIRDCGAYTLSMWSRHCSRGLPPVVGYDASNQSVSLLHRGETPEDVVRFWSR
ncbi:type III PLP-dependent enzyme domain-containing protein [Stieleria varia]|uniref:Diaminopimelate decarboxylase n=1 Tax=Stieleria varia TaxID=2528005 RepID=A0A5C6AYY6_9BACT|nr:diaminopimelate decarboxylase [Stieleria varia]TWU04888.1 Diaminopimelate decarboxylase [Stieleria varia]